MIVATGKKVVCRSSHKPALIKTMAEKYKRKSGTCRKFRKLPWLVQVEIVMKIREEFSDRNDYVSLKRGRHKTIMKLETKWRHRAEELYKEWVAENYEAYREWGKKHETA